MIKKRVAAMVLGAVIATQTAGFAASTTEMKEVQLALNDYVYKRAEVAVDEARLLIPLRTVFEVIGAEVHWDSATQRIEIKGDSTTIQLEIDSTVAYVKGVPVELEVPARLVFSERQNTAQTMVPLRFVAEHLGADVTWDGASQTVNMASAAYGDIVEKLKAKAAVWSLVLANRQNPLTEGYKPELKKLSSGYAVDARIYEAVNDMLADAKAAGLSPLVCSAYRSYDSQTRLFENQIAKYVSRGYSKAAAYEEAAKWVAVPGTSEHQTGLAVDIVATSYQVLNEAQEKTAEQQWLMANAHHYGFVLRYPKDKVAVTGISYEPWHYRYVGKEAARVIYEGKMCLEEYLEAL